MALQTPTIEEIKDSIIQDIEARINQTVRLLPKAFIRVLAAVLAGIYIQLFKYGGFIFLQIFVSTASFKETTIFGKILTPLIEWGRLFGIGDPTPAVQAVLTIQLTVNSIGSALLAGTQFKSSINDVLYITDQEILLDTNPKDIQVTATVGGDIGNLEVNDIVQSVNPIGSIDKDAVVQSVDTTGIDSESEENYRRRVLQIKQDPPQGGAVSDYRIWSVEVSGVVNAFPYSGDPGQVLVFVEGDRTVFPPDGIPSASTLLAVGASIDQVNRRPVTAIIDPVGDQTYINIQAITRVTFDVEIIGLTTTNPTQVQADILTALTEYMFDREPFIDGLTNDPRKEKITRNNVSAIIDDIVTADNGTYSSVSIEISGSPVTEYILAQGEMAKLGTLSFV